MKVILYLLHNSLINAVTNVTCTMLAIWYITEHLVTATNSSFVLVSVLLYLVCIFNMAAHGTVITSLENLQRQFNDLYDLAQTIHKIAETYQKTAEELYLELEEERSIKKEGESNVIYIPGRDEIKPS